MQAATRLWHETQHILRDSFDRLSPYVATQGSLVNLAQDLAINSSGRHGPWDFNPDGVLPGTYKFPEGLTAEEYFLLLLQAPPPPQKEKWGGCAGCGCGSGKPANAELEDKVDAELGRTPGEKNVILGQTARDILKAKADGKLPGDMAGKWEEWAKARLEPAKVPWEQKLANLTRHCLATYMAGGGIDYSFQNPSRRSYTGPVGTPSVLYPGPVDPVVEVAIILDTSGSMGLNEEIAIALREMKAVVESVGQRECWFLEVDARETAKAKRVVPTDLVNINIHGRGGTDFRPAFVAIEKLNPRPSVAVYMTDGLGPAPETKPNNLEVIWCLVGESARAPVTWGYSVLVRDLPAYSL